MRDATCSACLHGVTNTNRFPRDCSRCLVESLRQSMSPDQQQLQPGHVYAMTLSRTQQSAERPHVILCTLTHLTLVYLQNPAQNPPARPVNTAGSRPVLPARRLTSITQACQTCQDQR